MLNSKMNSIIGLKSNVFLAPMAGITDYPLRKLVAEKGTANLYSEMVAINAISRRNPKKYRIADVRNEPYPVIVQLVGNDPYLFSEAAKLAADLGAYSLDINMGCPVKKVVGNGSGSALMKNLPLASKIIESTVKAIREISKRLGQQYGKCSRICQNVRRQRSLLCYSSRQNAGTRIFGDSRLGYYQTSQRSRQHSGYRKRGHNISLSRRTNAPTDKCGRRNDWPRRIGKPLASRTGS